jgi:transposase InsO family protein
MRRAVYRAWVDGASVTDLSLEYKVTRKTVYKVLERARLKDFENHLSVNSRFRTIEYGLRRLKKTAVKLQKRIDRESIRRYEKEYPGEMVHFDTKRLPLLWGEAIRDKREHLHVAIDDFSRFLVADIFPDKGQYSSAMHLEEVIETAPFEMETAYSDNGSCYRGRKDHAFVEKCDRNGIGQLFTKPRHPWTNGKAERVIQTVMKEWHIRGRFDTREERRKVLQEYVAYYNSERRHSGIKGLTPLQRIGSYYASQMCIQRLTN